MFTQRIFRRHLLLAMTVTLALTGCASKLTSQEQFSGFLKDYSGLHEASTASGKPVLKWVDPAFKFSDYSYMIYKPVVYYPEPKPNTQLGQQALDEILTYTNTRVENAVRQATARQHIALTTQPGPRTLLMRSAITAVNTSNEGMQFYEVLPIAMVLAAGEVATGHRTQDSNIYFEGELIDTQTGKVVLKVVRKGQGKQLSNANKPVTADMLKGVVDNLASDVAAFQLN